MARIIGELIPLAFAVAISPLPIIAAILMLTPRSRSTSVAFLGGWLVGVAAPISVVALIASYLPDESDGSPSPITAAIRILLGVVLVVMATRRWLRRPKSGGAVKLPGWMAKLESFSPWAAAWLGFLLAAIKPKNLLLGIAGGVAVGAAGLSVGASVVAIVIFALLAACTVAVPVGAYRVAPHRMQEPLDGVRTWLVDNCATIMIVLLLTIGIFLIGSGIAKI